MGGAMRATLLYNVRSTAPASREEVLSALAQIGWHVDRSLSEQELESGLAHPTDVVVVTGGDGTVGMVAKRLAGTGIPMAIVPTGSANNIARSLGIGVGPSAAVPGLARPVERQVDLGVVHAERVTESFVEGFGLGVFAHVVAEKATTKDKTLPRAMSLIADELDQFVPVPLELEVDGKALSGSYVLVAVMNTRSLGPALRVAPEAKCDDGMLDVALVRPEAKRDLVAHLRQAAEEPGGAFPSLETSRATQIRMRAKRGWVHIDDGARELEGEIRIEVAPGAVRVLAPGP
jgi:diacylglycerol kinase family enzyme